MGNDNLFTEAKIEIVNQLIAELYDDSIVLPKRMEKFFMDLNHLVFFEKANFLFYQKQGPTYKTHSIYTINWNDEQRRKYEEDYCHMDDVLSILDSDSNVTFLTNQVFNQEVRKNSRYFQEFLLPMGLHDSIETNFSIKDRNLRGIFSIHRSNDKANFLPSDLTLMRLFQPHFRNVFKNFGKEMDINRIFYILDQYSCIGVGCFDDKLNFIGCNTIYQQYLERHGFLDFSNQSSFQLLPESLPPADSDRRNCRTEYRIQNGRHSPLSGGYQNAAAGWTSPGMFCLPVFRSILRDGPHSDTDLPGFRPDRTRKRCTGSDPARVFQ